MTSEPLVLAPDEFGLLKRLLAAFKGSDEVTGERKRQPTPAADATDDILIGITDGKPVATSSLLALPPWRAVLLARVADKAGIGLERGTLSQLVEEARAVTGAGVLGAWRERTP